MKTYNVNYKIKGKGHSKYIIIADFHGVFDLKLAKYISSIDAKYVIIAGDLLNGYMWNRKKKVEKLKKFLSIISTKHIVIVCLGNHDLWHLNNEGFNNFRSLDDKNIITLYNETKIIDNDAFTNFLPDKDCYSYFKQDSPNTIDKIINTYDYLFKPIDKKYTRHLISHNPYHFIHDSVIDKIADNYDIVEVGHFHDGWIPAKYLDKHYDMCLDKGIQEIIKNKILKTDYFSLSVNPKRNLSRGIVYMNKMGYFLLLPNGKVYYYDKKENKYLLSNKEELVKEKGPAIVITGAINTFLKLKIFYPYITTLEFGDDYLASSQIK